MKTQQNIEDIKKCAGPQMQIMQKIEECPIIAFLKHFSKSQFKESKSKFFLFKKSYDELRWQSMTEMNGQNRFRAKQIIFKLKLL